MSFFLVKSILGLILLLAGFIAFLSMLTLMGKKEKKLSVQFLKRTHKTAGVIFFILLLVISYLCLKYWARAGDQISSRAALHSVLAFGLVIIFLIKISIIRFFKQFLRYAPTLGMIVFALTFVVFSSSAGYYFLRHFCGPSAPEVKMTPTSAELQPDKEKGQTLFSAKCAGCHYADKAETQFGPGLLNLMKNNTLPSSQRPATEENVKNQLVQPYRTMPPFPNFSEQELADLIAYLKTL